ncbi:MAG: hypothetical protein II276_01595, partial [Bacteroidales bacterium]|nr:hypothetical protein [Bacteroidales bacterium]
MWPKKGAPICWKQNFLAFRKKQHYPHGAFLSIEIKGAEQPGTSRTSLPLCKAAFISARHSPSTVRGQYQRCGFPEFLNKLLLPLGNSGKAEGPKIN